MKLLKEREDNELCNLGLFANACWLNCGRFVLLAPIQGFLGEKKRNACQIFRNQRQKSGTVINISSDIIPHMNKLNLKFQGKDMLICDLVTQVKYYVEIESFSNTNQY